MEAVQPEVLKMRGSLRAILAGPNGEIIREIKQDNLLVTAGRAWILGQLNSVNINTSLTISYLGIGSSTIAPTTADTALGAEVTRQAILTFVTTGLTANPPSWSALVSFATNIANTTLAEIALLNSNSGGTMISHATYTSFVKATSNTFSVTYTVSD
jgi:hypothetical protein